MSIQFIQNIELALAQDLPGKFFQNKMSPLISNSYRILPPNYKIACVLLLLYLKNETWHTVLIERTLLDPNDKHAGQLSFPGGQLDHSDDTYEDCALRETYEEIGIHPGEIGILGALTPIYVSVSNFYVHPFVGFTSEKPSFKKQDAEVEDIIEIPLSIITSASNKKKANIEVRNIVLANTPYYDIYGKKLWGATAMIMSEFEEVLKKSTL